MTSSPPPAADGRAMQGVGCTATGCGCSLLLAAAVIVGMVGAGAVNYSAEGQALAGAATSGCCGGVGLLFGLVLVIVGGRRRQIIDGSAT